jgi:hypothetical protein
VTVDDTTRQRLVAERVASGRPPTVTDPDVIAAASAIVTAGLPPAEPGLTPPEKATSRGA